MNTAMYSSTTDNWSTPQEFFDVLNEEFDFTLDPCATPENAKCEKFYTIEDNGLSKSWDGERVFCNPPYGVVLKDWVKKAADARGGCVVLFIPARTDTRYFHEYIYKQPDVEIRFLKGRTKFGGQKNAAPFPSMIAVFRR